MLSADDRRVAKYFSAPFSSQCRLIHKHTCVIINPRVYIASFTNLTIGIKYIAIGLYLPSPMLLPWRLCSFDSSDF